MSRKMKRKLIPLMMLACGILSLASCLGDDSDYVFADDTAITSFTLGTLNQYFHTKSSHGLDSTYKKTVDCSGYEFYIDQIKCEIYNPDSLPVGIDAKKVLCNINTKNAGYVGIKSMTSDSLKYFSSTDSIDFSVPRDFYIYSNSGAGHRKYTIRVNVHKEQADSFVWKRMGVDANLAKLKGMKSAATEGHLFVFGSNGSNTLVYSSENGMAWTDITANLGVALSADAYKSIVTTNGYVYLYDNGQIMKTADGESWVVAGRAQLRQLVAASRFKLYAYDADGRLVESKDDGNTWSLSVIDDAQDLLPDQDITFVSAPISTNDDTDRVVMVGNRSAEDYPSDITPLIWGKIDEGAEFSENQPWTYYNVSSDNKYKAPRLRNIQTVGYDNCILAVGGESIGGTHHGAFDNFYRSADGGITWQKDSVVTIPSGITVNQNSFAITVDKDNFIWFVCGGSGQVWRGRTNRLGWIKEDNVFIE